jgi:hypothetical protein
MGPVAQWSEQGTHNPLVVGSIPTRPTMNKIKSFPWPTLLLIFPILAIIHTSNGSKEIQTNTTQEPYTWTSANSVPYYMDADCANLSIWSSALLSINSYNSDPLQYLNYIPDCAITKFEWEEQKSITKENKMNENAIVAISWVSIISLIVVFTYAYFNSRLKSNQAKEEREYNLRVKDIELNQTIKLQQSELERYKTLELSKTQMDNEHEVALKKLEFDKSLDARDFMLTVTKDEREYLLKQRELDIQEGKPSTSFMDMIDSNKDVQLRLKK